MAGEASPLIDGSADDPAVGGDSGAGDHGGRCVTQRPAGTGGPACAPVVGGDRAAGVQHAATLDDDGDDAAAAATLDGPSDHDHTHGDGWSAGDRAGDRAAHVRAATADPATDHDHAAGDGDDGAAHHGRGDDDHGRGDVDDPVSGAALVGPPVHDTTPRMSADALTGDPMDLLALFLLVAAIICCGLAALDIAARVELGWLGVMLFLVMLLVAGGFKVSVG
jgi:hypothetical protein